MTPGAGPVPGDLVDLRRSLAGTRGLFGAAACSCALVDPDGERLRFVAADGAGADRIVGVTIPVSRGIAGWVVLSGQSTGIADVASDSRFARDVAEATDYVPTSILAAPLIDPAGEVAGVVEVLDPTTAHLGLDVLAVVASQVEAVARLGGVTSEQGGEDLDLLATVRGLGLEQVPLARALLATLAQHR